MTDTIGYPAPQEGAKVRRTTDKRGGMIEPETKVGPREWSPSYKGGITTGPPEPARQKSGGPSGDHQTPDLPPGKTPPTKVWDDSGESTTMQNPLK